MIKEETRTKEGANFAFTCDDCGAKADQTAKKISLAAIEMNRCGWEVRGNGNALCPKCAYKQ